MRNLKDWAIRSGIPTPRSESLSIFYNDVRSHDLHLTTDEEFDIAFKYADTHNPKYRDMLVYNNMRFVISVAKYYNNMYADYEDLIQEGSIGLLDAVNKFDPTKGIKLTSYAVFWIRQHIMTFLINKNIIKYSGVHRNLAYSINKIRAEFFSSHGYNPTNEYLAEALNISLQQVISAMSMLEYVDSLDKCDEETGIAKVDVIASDSQTDKDLLDEDILINAKAVLANIKDETDLKIVKDSFGIGTRQKTLNEIALDLNMTKEGIRQRLDRIIRKLKCTTKH